MLHIFCTPDAYLEPSWKSMMDIFCKNSERLKVVNYFRKKRFIIVVWLGSKYAYDLANHLAYIVPRW